MIGLAQWQTAGYGAQSAAGSAAALFVDPASDRHLVAGCPAVDKGSPTDAPTDDLDGVARPQGSGVDIGCYEYSTVAPPADGSVADGAAPSDGPAKTDGGSTGDAAPASDGAPAGDAGTEEPEDDGCGCAAGGLDGPAGLCLLLLWGLRRRVARTRTRTRTSTSTSTNTFARRRG